MSTTEGMKLKTGFDNVNMILKNDSLSVFEQEVIVVKSFVSLASLFLSESVIPSLSKTMERVNGFGY